MALQFVLGKSGAGKSHLLYEKIIEESMKYPEKNYFIIVPEQFTMQTQRDLVELHPNHGILNIDILSFMRLAYRVFEEQGGMKRTILEDTGKSMLVRRVITEKKEELQIFKNYAHKPGYVSEIKSLLSEFYQYDVKDDVIQQMLELTKKDPMLQRKLEDMQVIYHGFEEQLADKYITTEEILDALIQQLDQTELLRDATLAFDGFTGFTPVQYRLLEKLMGMCENIWVTVTIDPKENPAMQREEISLFHLSRQTIDKLTEIAGNRGVPIEKEIALGEQVPYRFRNSMQLACLEHNLFRFSLTPYEQYIEAHNKNEGECAHDIRLYAAKDIQGEVDFTLREMAKLIREEGYRYRDIAIVTGDMETYGRILDKACKRGNIPCFIDYKKDIGKNPLVEYLRTVIQLFQKDFDYESMFRFLRCGLVDVEMENVDKMENHVLELGIRGFKKWDTEWCKRHKSKVMEEGEEQEYFALLNENRTLVVEMLEQAREVFKKKTQTVECYTRALHDLMVKQQIYHKLQAYKEKFEEQGEMLLAKEYDQVYELVLGIFDKLVQLLGDEKVTLQEYSELLETGFAEVKVGLIPPGVEQVVVGDIERTRLKDIKALFFLGVNEGIVPSVSSKGGILSDMEREKLAQNQITLAPTPRETAFTQQFYFYLNMTKPNQKLFLTYHKADQEGKAAMPSSLVRSVRRIFLNLPVEEEKRICLDAELTEEEMEQMLGVDYGKAYVLDGMREVENTQLADWWKELYSFYSSKEEWKEDRELWIRGVGFDNQENNLSKQVANALYGKEMKNSVTRVERYAACAYAHFLQYGLQLRERYEYHFGNVDFGNVFHRVLRIFPKELEKSGTSWREATREQMDLVVEKCLLEVTTDYENAILESNEQAVYLVERMERMLKRTMWALAEQLKQGKFEPKGYELHFETMDGLASTKMDLGEDRMLRLQGQIDRMDLLEEEDKVYVKVVDYKTGQMKFDIVNLYYGLQMQLVVYLNAAMDLEKEKYKGKEILPAGIFYYNIDDPVVERASEEKVDAALLKELKMNGLVNDDVHVVSMLDQAFGNGEQLNPSVKSWVIPVDTVSSGAYGRNAKVASKDNFQVMSEYAKERIKNNAVEILDGTVEVNPYQKGKNTACDYCAYAAVCNFDTRLPGNHFRKLAEIDNKEAWECMRKELEEKKGEE